MKGRAVGKGPAFHRQVFQHLRTVSEELPGGEAVGRGAEAVGRQVERGIDAITERVGGPARVRVVALLAGVLALSAADTGAIAAVAPKLETTLGIGNVQIGLLVTVASLAAATAMLPVGWVTDRTNRTRMVKVAVLAWAGAEIVSAFSPNYAFLLVVRVALGVLTAVTGPTLASLTGDLFPAEERSEIYGYILTGELLGAGLGLLIAGLFSSWATWRVALAILSLPSLILAWQFHKKLPEPARGGQSRLERGAEEILAAEDAVPEAEPGPPGAGGGAPAPPPRDDTPVLREVRRRRINPRKGVILDRDPLDLGMWESFRYVIAVRSNLTLILASALGYFFLGGVETFTLIYLEGHFKVGQSSATLIALGVGATAVFGAISGGRVADSLLHHGRLDSRFLVPAVASLLTIVFFAPGVISTEVVISLPLFLVAGFFIGAPNPGLDAARLDVMPARMWGRGEAVRSFLRALLQAFAPLVFGVVSTVFGGHNAGLGANGIGSHKKNAALHATGLEQTFLIMMVALLAAAAIVWYGRRAYPVDVAAADETERRFPASLPVSASTGAETAAGSP